MIPGDKKYNVILADPPWSYSDKNTTGAADGHYPTMSLGELALLPVADLAADPCVLFLWVCRPMIKEALILIDAWGFAYKTFAFTWIKTTRGGEPHNGGIGHYTRSNCEDVLIATRGGRLHRASKSVSSVVLAPRGRHSAKPPEVRDRIVQLYGDLPRIELFARERVPGWDAWGNEV
jgi:N6-adenosine-specific RNA methylase IME4